MVRSPSGTVTFLLTDVEESTQAWESDADSTAAAIARQEEILATAIAAHRGFLVEQGEGDSVVAAFARASDAVAAAVDAQLALAREPWTLAAPLRVRMALHTGEAEVREGRYAGAAIIRTARLGALGHGGQTLVSRATAEVVGDSLPPGTTLMDLGSHRLRDLVRAEHVFQITHTELSDRFPPLRSLDRVANNLPAQLTSFVGREAELVQVERLLAQVRLLTLTGAGGCGKTRLAAHAAAAVADSYPAGVWWVELAAVGPGSAVSTAVLSALGLREHPSRSALDQLADQFGQGRALLVADNCEHLLDPVVDLLEPLLGRCPELTVLTTSREPLGIAGETTWRVPPLALPAASSEATPETVTAYDAVALFVDRARPARANVAVTNDNSPAVAEICARLDGIPLAIELAAARVRVLSPEGIRSGLDDRFRLLTGGSKHGLPRQQTLAASVEWSHDLLNEAERAMLRRLAVFVGGFTLDAAEAACSGDGVEPLQVLDLVTSLVDKSLVVTDDGSSLTRYRLLETIRQFALAQLEASGEVAGVRDAHLAVQLRLAAEAEDGFMSDDDLTGREEAEHDNLRAALEWAFAQGRLDDAARLLVGLSNLWFSRGLLREALVWFDRLLAHPDVDRCSVLYRVWWARGVLAAIDGRPDPALDMPGEVASQAGAAGDQRYVARGLTLQGLVDVMVDPAAGEKALQGALELADAVDDPFSSQWTRVGLIVAGIHQEDHVRVMRYAEEAHPRFDGTSGQMRSMYHGLVGFSDVRAGRFDDARSHGEEARQLAAEVGDPTLAEAMAILTLGLVELAQGRVEEAAAVIEPALREPRPSGPTREDPMLTGAWGRVLAARGDLDGAEAVIDDSIRLAEQVGDGLQYDLCLGWQVGLLRSREDRSRAGALAEVLLTHARQQGNLGSEAIALRELSNLARLDGQLDAADDLAHRSLALSVAAGILPDVAQGLVAVAGIAAAEESWEEAVRLFAAAEALGRQLGSVFPSWDQPAAAADLDLVRSALKPEVFEEAWAEGQALGVDEAVAYAQRGRGKRKRPSAGWAGLTPMERQVVDLVADGLRNTEIATRLFIAPSTVKTHLAHVFAKLGVSTRAELAALAARRRA